MTWMLSRNGQSEPSVSASWISAVMLSVEAGGACTSGMGWRPSGGFSTMVALTGVSLPFMTPLPWPKIEGSRKNSAMLFF
ncbi:hypothetical protein D3C87_2065270 [compost metagenome]